MCILFVCTDPEPPQGGYRLIVASNRDEFYKRPAMKAFMCEKTNIIGGRDMEKGREGGMWLGISLKESYIKMGALLNVTGVKKIAATAGRGPLVHNYLQSDKSALEYTGSLTDKYSPFNLFMAEVGVDCKSFHCSNSPNFDYTYSGRQILGFGNSTPTAPFTKVQKGRDKFEEIINKTKDKTELVDKLLSLLKCQDLHLPDEELARRAPQDVNYLSSIYVHLKDGGYGTRTHSIVLVDLDFNVEFIEHTMKEPILDSGKPDWEVTVIHSKLLNK